MEDVLVAVLIEVELPRPQFDDCLIRHKVQMNGRKVRITGPWTFAGELRIAQFDDIVPVGSRVGQRLELRDLLLRLEREYGAPRVRVLYCSVDPEIYFPEHTAPAWDLGYMGTYSEDRHPTLDALLVRAACGSTVHCCYQVVNNYLNMLAEGDYPDACRMLTPQARAQMAVSTGVHASCPTILTRCLPSHALVLKEDQSQLFYATVQVTTQGSTARAAVSGTAVANVLREVTLQQTRTGWQLTSSGSGLTACSKRHPAR